MTLAEFLAARLDEKETAAKIAAVDDAWGQLRRTIPPEPGTLNRCHRLMDACDPARVLRDVAAKRKILAAHQPERSVLPPSDDHKLVCVVCSQDWWPCDVLRTLGEIDSGHPDYNPEWRP